ncbi:MAG TPA: hypothetical protein VFF45_00400 [Bacilli bacterium]|nr:hypothetical protein [Bacilli bacterium]
MNGEHVWSRSFGVPRPQVGTAIAAWGSEVILAGHFQGTLNTGGSRTEH